MLSFEDFFCLYKVFRQWGLDHKMGTGWVCEGNGVCVKRKAFEAKGTVAVGCIAFVAHYRVSDCFHVDTYLVRAASLRFKRKVGEATTCL